MKTVPVEAKFYSADGRYIVGTENMFESMTALDGKREKGGLGVGNYTKYTLEWQWPFDGDDTFDTMLGNMASEGDEITVAVKFNIVASEDVNAYGGTPQTGDIGKVALWTGICVCSAVVIVILLFGFYKKDDEEDEKNK